MSDSQTKDIVNSIGFNIKNKQESNYTNIPAALFVTHTYNSLLIKLLGAEIVSAHGTQTAYRGFAEATITLDDAQLLHRIDLEIERGGFFSRAGIDGFVEEAIFSWYLDACNITSHTQTICNALRNLLVGLALYRTDSLAIARSRDVLKHFYQDLVPDSLRKSLGEFYTPDWLVEVTLDKAEITNWLADRFLDPTCGSASFLLAVIKRIREAAIEQGWGDLQTLQHIMRNVWGFDLNPLAVQAARVNLLIAVSDLLASNPGTRIELPILLADAVYSPARNPGEGEDTVDYTIGSSIANLKITLPATLAFDRLRLDGVFFTMGQMVEKEAAYDEVEHILITREQLSTEESALWKTALSETYGRVLDLHLKNWNGIWFRIVRNFFWSATAGEFDVVVGNPPWVRWSKLPDLYRERVKPTCQRYDIFSHTPYNGGNELDISAMISYTVSDKWLRDGGKLIFLVTQTLFQSPSSEGFRRFKINDSYRLVPKSVDDLKALKPFSDAANKTAIFVAEKSSTSKPIYPLPYFVWNAAKGSTKAIPTNLSKQSVLNRVVITPHEATPVGGEGSPWAILPSGHFTDLAHFAKKSTWAQGRKGITVDLNGIYFVNITAENATNNLVEIESRPEACKTDIGPKHRQWIEPDLLYPLLKGASDFSACYVKPKNELFTLVPNLGIKQAQYQIGQNRIENQLLKTFCYFNGYKELLKQRSTYKGRMPNAPFYAIYNVGDYTFAPWKVVWAEQKNFCSAVVSDAEVPLVGRRTIVPDHKLFFVDFEHPHPAYFLCGLLNTVKVRMFIESHVIKTQIGNIFKHLELPEFDQDNHSHVKLACVVMQAHSEDDTDKRLILLDQIANMGDKIITKISN